MKDNPVLIQPVKLKDIPLLQDLLSRAGNSLDSFRYFNKRSFSVIQNHKLTVILYFNGEPCGYGHLDEEDDKIWLGLMIVESFKRKGLGKRLLEYLLDYADSGQVSEIFLSVDKSNQAAISLYNRFGFLPEKCLESRSFILMKRKLHGNLC
ncbi:GNAT family N-acetyltransferase [Parapedobacter sp. ISTM3]|uniref:GNAT family N-acetyltransferase n=1 Tax=Parapedobacter sp. ISTM3 TaxID=2800130 RepID=UPI001906BACB|nr:GNAT family N-acetyltransferase [Parapedobacter sp. ISTM3]MBK1438369.1 GNAT family N-acetyltransferase [Parapedobacter sp. ISTM3]